MENYCRETWIEVNLDAIQDNLHAFRKHIPEQARVMAVVKANGYGHGAVQVGRHALAHGADALAVAMLDEAIALRKNGITAPILVLGYTPVESIIVAVKWNIQLTVYHEEWVQKAEQILSSASVTTRLGLHVKVDTGMGRIGVQTEEELLLLVQSILSGGSLSWEGIFTHFACADEADTSHVHAQHDRFQHMLNCLREKGLTLPLVHCNNSAASITFPQWSYDMIRLGISLYGLYPSPYLKQQGLIKLTPALSLKTRIAHVKKISGLRTVSYGATYEAQQGETIATLPIGYADGYSRQLSNRGHALIRGHRVPIVGRVCMDQIMISLSEMSAELGEEIVLYGKQGDAEICLDEVAALIGTINYEVPCMLNHRIPRLYVSDGKVQEVSHFVEADDKFCNRL